jgi:hypothetical protein
MFLQLLQSFWRILEDFGAKCNEVEDFGEKRNEVEDFSAKCNEMLTKYTPKACGSPLKESELQFFGQIPSNFERADTPGLKSR